MLRGLTVVILLECAISALSAGHAAESASVVSKRSVATIVSDVDRVAADQPFHAALRLRLAPGWHTYWQNPGDAGIPPDLVLTLSSGSSAEPIVWPVPHRVAEGTLTTYAYTGDVVLPFTVTPGQGELSLHAHAEWLTCKDICVPEAADLELALPPGQPGPSAEAALISTALAHVPTPASFATTVTSDGVLTVTGPGVPTGVRSAEFFPLTVGVTERSAAQLEAAGHDGLRIKLDAVPTTVSTDQGVLVLTAASGDVTAYRVSPKRVQASSPAPFLPLLLLAALAGGLLLNLMPCVFPILAMKAMAIARMSGANARRVRAEAISYSCGIVAAFVLLGMLLVALRGVEAASGWGFQFQSPTFVTAVCWLLFAIGLNLSGVFTVGESLMGRGEGLARTPGHAGSVLTGMLAVVVASPCTAPFMGTALAGALALSSPAALTIFVALGLGLALPYAALAFIPRLTALLPRPGAWMLTLQQALAFPMYGAAVWLLWVLSQQTGPAGVLLAGAGAVAIGLGAWSLAFARRPSGAGRYVARFCLAGLGVLLFTVLLAARPGNVAAAKSFEPFTTTRLDELRREGQPVFVNMTASWCLSCLVNEQFALSTAAVDEAFKQSHVVYLKGDWTSRNSAVSAFLREFGQDGVPLYVLFAPGRPPKVLPQLLSPGTVLSALAAAAT